MIRLVKHCSTMLEGPRKGRSGQPGLNSPLLHHAATTLDMSNYHNFLQAHGIQCAPMSQPREVSCCIYPFPPPPRRPRLQFDLRPFRTPQVPSAALIPSHLFIPRRKREAAIHRVPLYAPCAHHSHLQSHPSHVQCPPCTPDRTVPPRPSALSFIHAFVVYDLRCHWQRKVCWMTAYPYRGDRCDRCGSAIGGDRIRLGSICGCALSARLS